jgi:hypothetical protein
MQNLLHLPQFPQYTPDKKNENPFSILMITTFLTTWAVSGGCHCHAGDDHAAANRPKT